MNKPIISVEHLSKRYKLGQIGVPKLRFRWPWSHGARGLNGPSPCVRDAAAVKEVPENEIWALRDASFEVQRGDALGVIGPNGAGKSTLLKVLTRITEPTSGRAVMRGRVASLLEVGTGFHPDLTGRENVYLNGAILGMRKAEIARKFDAMVAFAEVERFVDTPVKRYSSGMYVRLAFAVAAHLDPEILLIDEVLAVGDVNFQKRCLGKMSEVVGEGRTILFVSHNMAAVQRLCRKAVVVRAGQVSPVLPADAAVGLYLQQMRADDKERPGGGGNEIRVTRLGLVDAATGEDKTRFDTTENIELRLEYDLSVPLENVRVGVRLLTPEGFTFLSAFDTDNYPDLHARREVGHYSARMVMPDGFFIGGEYLVRVMIYEHHGRNYFDDATMVLQVKDPLGESGATGWGYRVGPVRPNFRWDVTHVPHGEKALGDG